jgi:hypothetical protein
MATSSVYVNNVLQVLPNPYALTIKPRLEYSAFLANSILKKLQKEQKFIRESNRQFYLENEGVVADNAKFKETVYLETCIACGIETIKIAQRRLNSISNINNLSQIVSPLVSVVRTISSNLYLGLPQISRDLVELSGLLGSIVMDSGSLSEVKFDFKQTNLESRHILAEVNLIVESKIRTSYPNLST